MKNLRVIIAAALLVILTVGGLAAPLALNQTDNRFGSVDNFDGLQVAQAGAEALCPDVAHKAFQNVDNKCDHLGRNRVCLAQPDITANVAGQGLNFSKPGDTTNIQPNQSYKLGGFDGAAGTWGALSMSLQANLPDSSDQNVALLAFGDVELSDASQPASDALATTISATRSVLMPTIGAVDTMLAPTQQARNTQIAQQNQAFNTQVYATSNAQGTQARGTLVAESTAISGTAYARSTTDSATIQAFLAGQNQTAQARATLQSARSQQTATIQYATVWAQSTSDDATTWARNTADVASRSQQDADVASTARAQDSKLYNTLSAPLPIPTYRPMQSFTLKTGPNVAACAGSPRNGVLIQTPPGKTIIRLVIDGVIFDASGTFFVEAQPGGNLSAYVVDGSLSVTASGVTQPVLSGMVVRVPIDADAQDSGAPQAASAYNPDDVKWLPLKSLPNNVKLASPRPALDNGSLISNTLGEACTNGLTAKNSTDNKDALAVPVGGQWKATAGTTATFSVSGNVQVQGIWKNYIALAPAGNGYAGPVEASAFAVSGTSTTLTYTFPKDISEFYVDVGVNPPGDVTLTVTCSRAPTAVPTETFTPTETNTVRPSSTPRPTRTPSPSATATRPRTKATVTITSAASGTPSLTSTLEASPTETVQPTDTLKPSDTPTDTPSPTDTPAPSDSPVPTDTPTQTPTIVLSPTGQEIF